MSDKITLQQGDALVGVDVQNDFLPGGSVAVPGGDEVIEPLNRAIACFQRQALPVFFTRDWHPPDHCSFTAQGGTWPPHCVRDTPGAQLARALHLPPEAIVVSKATRQEEDAYSGFQHTEFHELLQKLGVKRLFIGGLATDYCVLNTVKDGLALGYEVYVLEPAIRAVNLQPGDGERAVEHMRAQGAQFIDVSRIEA